MAIQYIQFTGIMPWTRTKHGDRLFAGAASKQFFERVVKLCYILWILMCIFTIIQKFAIQQLSADFNALYKHWSHILYSAIKEINIKFHEIS